MPLLRLSSITCMVPDESDKDELYLVHEGVKIWPKKSKYHKIDVDESVKLNMVFKVTVGWIAIEVWDYDFASKNNHLGTFHFKIVETPGKFTCTMTNNEEVSERASYLLNWEIIEEQLIT